MLDLDDKTSESIVCDPKRLKQIMINLMRNAQKFCNKGFIMLKVSSSFIHSKEANAIQEAFYIEVKDTGVGISEKNKGKLF